MTTGPGKYDEESSRLQEKYQAEGVIVIVVGGSKGEGFSVTGTVEFAMVMPQMLRYMAEQLENDVRGELQ